MKSSLFSILVFVSLSLYITLPVRSETLQEKLERMEREIKEIRQQRSNIESQLNNLNQTLYGFDAQLAKLNAEIAMYENGILELQLEIDKVETEIKINEEKINKLKFEIVETENSIQEIEFETNRRITDSYLNFRMYGTFDGAENVFGIENINDYFKTTSYKEIVQSQTNKLLAKINLLRIQLVEKKRELDNIQVENAKKKDLLIVQTADLQKKKQDSASKQAQLLQEVYNIRIQKDLKNSNLREITEAQRRKQAEVELVRQQIINNFVPKDPGTYVLAGTYIAKQGATGFVTGAHLHFEVYINNQRQNPCNFLPSGLVNGCGVNDSRLQWPVKDKPIYFTSGFGPRCFNFNGSPYCDFHTGIDIVATPWNAPIYSAHDGFVHKGVDQYGGRYIILCESANCSVGLKTAYWHLSEF